MGGLAGPPLRPTFHNLTWEGACRILAGCEGVQGGFNELESGAKIWVLVLQVGSVNILKMRG